MRTKHAAFVAEARRVYQPAAAWLRANGWRNNLINKGLRLSMDYDLRGDRGLRPFVNVMRRTEWGTYLGNAMLAEVTSLTQAIDYLVTAEVLPAQFHSLHASCCAVENPCRNGCDEDDSAEAVCTEEGHPMAVYDRVRNASLCVCGQAYERGDFHAKPASVTA
jgi:hypothetical protein